jgi:hypothetical protein
MARTVADARVLSTQFSAREFETECDLEAVEANIVPPVQSVVKEPKFQNATQYTRVSFIVFGVRLRRVYLVEVTLLQLEIEGGFVIADELEARFAEGGVE